MSWTPELGSGKDWSEEVQLYWPEKNYWPHSILYILLLGTVPSARIGHRMQANGTRIMLYGGGMWSFSAAKWQDDSHEFFIYDTGIRNGAI